MSNSVLITGVLLILLAGLIAIILAKLFFKKSIVFNIVAVLTLPILNAVIMGFIVGARGLIHLTWAAPFAVIFILGAYGIVTKMIKGPLAEMLKKVDSLVEGDVHIGFEDKFLKGGNELAKLMRRLVRLTDSLKGIVDFANHIGKGELDVEYTLLGDKDTLGKSMLNMRHNLQEAEIEKQKRQHEDEQRNWVTIGVAKFAELLRVNNDNIEELCHSIVSNMVKYVGANQAGIFILNDDEPKHPILELKACYAYERRKFLQKTIEMGEGLLGTCFLERQSIYMTQLPKDYIHITSGLGDETPRALLIVPLMVNEEIYGVIEIAAFTDFESHVREFVEKVAESIASTIAAVKVNIRTNKLLELSKIQGEEMAGQEEELRQNMEEMQATQEEMARKQREAEAAQQQLMKTNANLEARLMAVPAFVLSTDLHISNVSNVLLSEINCSEDQVIGLPVSDLVVTEGATIDGMLHEKVLAGHACSGEGILLGKQKISFYASPVYHHSEIDKILFVCIDLVKS